MNKNGLGYLIVACNTRDIDYLKHAYYLACSIKDTQKQYNKISIIVNDLAAKSLKSVDRDIFDQVIKVNQNTEQKDFAVDANIWNLSPYKQTIKIESDMILTSNIDHWWAILDQKDIVLTNCVQTYWGEKITNRSQRKLFDDNLLPDVYSGFMYFRYSKESQKFFNIVQQIFSNWDWYRDYYLKNCRYQKPVSDEVFAIAARIYGVENCTLTDSVLSFVHMKNGLQKLPNEEEWWQYVFCEKNLNTYNVGFYKQTLPLHYHNKKFIDQLEKFYDQ